MTIFDSSGIEAFVTENNPKYANRIIKQLKAYAKAQGFDKSYDPYKAAYGSMPSHASANPEIKQLYINGHFCYVFKFGIVTNGLGIIRHISFYNKNFMASHPDIVVEKKSDSPDEDKCVHDSKLLIPTLKDFFSKHPLINPKTFLGDAAFDTAQLYKSLLTGDTFGNDKHSLTFPFISFYFLLYFYRKFATEPPSDEEYSYISLLDLPSYSVEQFFPFCHLQVSWKDARRSA